MALGKKSNPLEVKMEIMNAKDWKTHGNLKIRVVGMFRNSGWKVKEHFSKVKGSELEININAEHSGGLAAMVLTPFEVIEDIRLDNLINYSKIRILIDGEEFGTYKL